MERERGRGRGGGKEGFQEGRSPSVRYLHPKSLSWV